MADFLSGTRELVTKGYNAALRAGNGNPTTQSYHNAPVPNLQQSIYTLQIRDPNNPQTALYSYTFPLSPESIRKEFTALTNYYDVQGDAANLGVQRIVDIYGQTPVTYVIEGTTGWQLHQTDAYKYTGLQSIAQLEGVLATFAQLNQGKLLAGDQNLYELWFFDSFRGEAWVVVPIGTQGIRQSVARPLMVNYAFRLLGIRNLGNAEKPVQTDTLAQTLNTSDATAAQTYNQFATVATSDYGDSTAPAT